MKKVLLLFTILFVSVITTACINNFAIQELNNKAAAYMDKGDTQTAICRLKSSLDLDSEVYQTHYNLAIAYSDIGNYEQAIEEAQTALKLKEDLNDAYYTIAVAKEALAYKLIENEEGTINTQDLAPDVIVKFNDMAQEAIDTYNEYLVKKVDAAETEQINAKITELNNRIKEYTQFLDKNAVETQDKVLTEINETQQSPAEGAAVNISEDNNNENTNSEEKN